MSRSVSAALILLALGALPLRAETLGEVLKTLIGTEVEISGHIGTGLNLMDDEALTFRSADRVVYPVVFDAGRQARKQLEGCEFALFGGGSPCALTGKAELDLDGSQLRLIIFDVTSISPPAPLE